MRSFTFVAVRASLLYAALGVVPANAAAQDYFSDVRPVLVQNCMPCHTSDGIGWSMEDAEQTYALRQAIAAAVLERRMPPWLAEAGHLEPGAGLVVQMHYYAGAAPGERDADTRMDFLVAPRVRRPAFHYAQTRDDWLEGERTGSMVVPPGEMATYEVSTRLGDLLGYVARVTQVDPDRVQALEVHSANLHMHAIGHSGQITLTDPSGHSQTLLSVPRWDLRWQRDFTFPEPKVFPHDDLADTRLTVQCTFSNPSSEPVFGGYGSDEEMCFNFSYIAVRTGDAAQNP